MLSDRIRFRLLDLWDRLRNGPRWIDSTCRVDLSAIVISSRLSGRVEVGAHARLFRVLACGIVRIGYSSSLWGPNIEVHAERTEVTIGNYCSIARGVGIYESFHDYSRLSTYYVGRNILSLPHEREITSKGPINIGHDVWIGSCAHILSGVTVGNGAVIGAGAVVTADIPPFAVAAGSPARVVGYRFDQRTQANVEALGWWHWDRSTLRHHADLFTRPVSQIDPETLLAARAALD